MKTQRCPNCDRDAYMLGGVCEFCKHGEGQHNPQHGLSEAQIQEATAIIYDTVSARTATIWDMQGPIFGRFESLPTATQTQAFEGLAVRIQKETLRGYVERKRPDWGNGATDAVIRNLEERQLITTVVKGR